MPAPLPSTSSLVKKAQLLTEISGATEVQEEVRAETGKQEHSSFPFSWQA